MVLDDEVLPFTSRAIGEQTTTPHVRDANLFSALAALSERCQAAKNGGGTGFPQFNLTAHRLELSSSVRFYLDCACRRSVRQSPHESQAISYKPAFGDPAVLIRVVSFIYNSR